MYCIGVIIGFVVSISSHCRRTRPPKKVVHCLLRQLCQQLLAVARSGVSEFPLSFLLPLPAPWLRLYHGLARRAVFTKTRRRVRDFLQRTQVPEKFNSSFWRPKYIYPSSLLLVITLRYFPQFELFDKTHVLHGRTFRHHRRSSISTAAAAATRAMHNHDVYYYAIEWLKQPLQLVVSLLGVSEFLSPAAWLGTALRTRPRAVL